MEYEMYIQYTFHVLLIQNDTFYLGTDVILSLILSLIYIIFIRFVGDMHKWKTKCRYRMNNTIFREIYVHLYFQNYMYSIITAYKNNIMNQQHTYIQLLN